MIGVHSLSVGRHRIPAPSSRVLRYCNDVALLNGNAGHTRCQLTLSDLPNLESLKFLLRCNVTDLRLFNYPEAVREEYTRLGTLHSRNDKLCYLLLQQDWLVFCDKSFIAVEGSVQYLEDDGVQVMDMRNCILPILNNSFIADDVGGLEPTKCGGYRNRGRSKQLGV
ncbi:hypothetical protein HPB52_002015 [Rhipicephalus sanguineus]|uniref:Uncharacterized protein n=1 Tax=Rhipicephalus sanguineus TaxID=34632 RepID=A0A9D4Q4Z2_RHISA|nr:hypothetical protein HPB52_002015 [Rhipicephalus sanguineus]